MTCFQTVECDTILLRISDIPLVEPINQALIKQINNAHNHSSEASAIYLKRFSFLFFPPVHPPHL